MIRDARQDDCSAMCAIYLPYVRDTAITFEEALPTEETFINKLAHLTPHYPFFVYEAEGQIAAYAYASPFRERAAYRWGAELSVYVAPPFHSQGIGKALYKALLDALTQRGFQTAYGVITLPNEKSLRLHEHFGFERVGVLHNTGYKLGRWLDVIIFEKALGDYPEAPAWQPPRKTP